MHAMPDPDLDTFLSASKNTVWMSHCKPSLALSVLYSSAHMIVASHFAVISTSDKRTCLYEHFGVVWK